MWTDFIKPYADPVIKQFEKETGMDFEYMDVPQTDYIKTVTGKIAAGTGPDVIINNSEFPGIMTIAQPVNDYVDLSDPIWDAAFSKAFTVKGKTYTISADGSFFGGGGANYCLYYNKSLLNKAGVTNPGELYKAGNWNWDTYTALMKAYTNSATKVKGTSAMFLVGSYHQISVGAAIFKYDPNTLTFSSNLDDPLVSKVLTKMAEWGKNGYTGSGNLFSGKAAMQLAFTMTKKDVAANGTGITVNDIGVVPAPDFDSENKRVKIVSGKGWGIAKRAKNPVGAGIFIKYYSDPGNYDADEFFVTSELRDLHFKQKSETSAPEYFECMFGVASANGIQGGPAYWNLAQGVAPDQISKKINEITKQTEARAAEATKVLRNAVK